MNNIFDEVDEVETPFAILHQIKDASFSSNSFEELTSEAARLLAKGYLEALSVRGSYLPGTIALLFELEDGDTAARSFRAALQSSVPDIRLGCFWLQRRQNSFDKVLVEVIRDHVDDLSGVEMAIILQPAYLRPEAVKAMLLRLGGMLDQGMQILVMAPFASGDMLSQLNEYAPASRQGNVNLAYFEYEAASSQSVPIVPLTTFGTARLRNIPPGIENAAFYPEIVLERIRLDLEHKAALKSSYSSTSFDGT